VTSLSKDQYCKVCKHEIVEDLLSTYLKHLCKKCEYEAIQELVDFVKNPGVDGELTVNDMKIILGLDKDDI